MTKVIHIAQATQIGCQLLEAAGVPAGEAKIVIHHLAQANLAGHDSHGIMMLPRYLADIEKGHLKPGAGLTIEDETPTTARICGNWGLGYVVTNQAMKVAIDKARQQNVAALTVYEQGHIGRLGGYVQMAARAGMIGLMTCDSGLGPKAVAPFGGRARRLGTNPLACAFPSDLPGPVTIDLATSAVAVGKLGVVRSKGQALPDGWIIDKYGQPSNNIEDYYDGGALLPLGGDQGHKGYALSFMVETFSGLLTGLGFGIDLQGRHNDGTFIALINVEAFRPLQTFKNDVADFVQYLKETPTSDGMGEVLYPGELEFLTAKTRRVEGIPVPDSVWEELATCCQKLGVDTDFV